MPSAIKLIRFAGALTLTHDAASLVLPSGAHIVTAAGDTALATSDSSGNWRVWHYQRADGTALAGGGVGGGGGDMLAAIYDPTGVADDAFDRANHHGEQAIGTINGLQAALDAKATLAYVDAAVAALVDSSPLTLDTLNELAAALGDDPNFATTVTNALAAKAPINNPVFTGAVTLPGDPASALEPATKQYVDANAGGGGATVYFKASKSADQTGVSSDTDVKVTFPSEVQDTNSYYDTTTSRFTPQTAGTYLFVAAVQFAAANMSDQKNLNILLFRNGVEIARSLTRTSGAAQHNVPIVALAAANGSTDYFDIYVRHAVGANLTIFNDPGTYFSAIKL